jgi:pimeloyl-ACP methyl ester carboxylesterase
MRHKWSDRHRRTTAEPGAVETGGMVALSFATGVAAALVSPGHAGGAGGGMPPPGRRHEDGGRRLALHHSGIGGPAVVFLPGAGLIGRYYLNIHDEVSMFTTSVFYDRAGTGWSDQVPLTRSAADVTDELRNLLCAAGIPGPYVLVGHSLGGLYARDYARRFPGEVAGLLLLDPGHEDCPEHTPKRLLGPIARLRMLGVALRVTPPLRRFHDDVRHAGATPDTPMIVLTAMGKDAVVQAIRDLLGRVAR